MMDGRGQGCTSGQLAALPDGAIYLVSHRPMADYCRRLLVAHGRDPAAITFVTVCQVPQALWGVRIPAYDVDHFTAVDAPHRALREARLMLDRGVAAYGR